MSVEMKLTDRGSIFHCFDLLQGVRRERDRPEALQPSMGWILFCIAGPMFDSILINCVICSAKHMTSVICKRDNTLTLSGLQKESQHPQIFEHYGWSWEILAAVREVQSL